MIRFTSGVLLAFAALLGAYFLEGGNGLSLLGLTAFMTTCLVSLFSVLAVWPFSAWVGAWHDALGTPSTPERSAAIWKLSEFAFYLSGLLGSLLGGILILSHWDNAAISLPRRFGALLIAPLYGTFFALVCRILRARVEARS